MTFTVSRAGSAHGTSSVHYATGGVTAISGVDFAPAEGVLHFPTGVTSRTLTVDVTADRLDELDEIFVVNLSNPTGGHIIDGQGQGTITDDDSSPVAASQSPSTNEDTALPVTLVATDVECDPLTYSIVTPPAHGALSGSGADRTYTPAANYNGPDSFTFRATDGVNESNVATVSITVNPVQRPAGGEPELGDPRRGLVRDGRPARDRRRRRPTHLLDRHAARRTAPSRALATAAPTRRPPNYNGSDSFTFKANDGTVDSNVGHRLADGHAGQRPAGRGQRHGDRRRGRLHRRRRARQRLRPRRRPADRDGGRHTGARHRGHPGRQRPLHAGARTTTAATASRTRSPTATAAPTRPRSR